MRVECWVRTSVRSSRPPRGCCCGVYKGTISPHTPQGMVLWGLQRYYLSPHTPRVLLWGLQRYYLSPHTPRDGAVGFTEVLSLPTHPKGCCCGVYKGTISPHTPQGMVLWGLQRYYLSPHTPRDGAVGFTEVLPLPTHPAHPRDGAVGFTEVLPLPTHPAHPRDAAVGFTEVLPLPTPRTLQGMLLWGLQRYYLSPHTHTLQGMLLWGLQRYYLSPHTPRDAAVGFTKVLPLPTHPKGCCCGVYRGTASPQTPRSPCTSNSQGRYTFHIVMCQGTCELIGFKLGMMLNTAKLCRLISVRIILMFAQSHRVTEKLELVQSLCCKTA